MSKVARVELWHVEVPLPATFHPSWIPGFPQNENRFTLIRVTTESGVDGFSAGPAMGHERAGLGDLVGPYLIGTDATDIEVVQQRLREMGYLGFRNWWIEPAFWDIKGKLAGKPVYELLGGRAQPVPLYASTGEVRAPEARIAEAEARYAEGFRALKLRVHDFDERVDERQVIETAKALGGRMKLGVDANQAWRVSAVAAAPRWDLARAKRFADVCADAGLAWLEEPQAMDAYEDQAALVRYARLPITGGEIHTSGLPELKMMIERRCYSIFQPDAVFTGGIAQTMEVAQLCKEHGLGYTPHTWTNGIGFAVNLQLYLASGFAGQKELEYPLDPPGWVPSARDGILETPFLHDHGMLAAPTLPGLGFEIDERALRRFGTRFFAMDRKRLMWFSLRTRGLRASLQIDRASKAAAARPGGAR
jgi:L-alanine-DL-glutamate epimerase-like enolase superfamily enzyme